ncbi:MAG: type II toxin-antitoxin system VapC family toxin [Bacteroidales bacterium]|nr:type II toxin-antitoxin system VapC family toxin [Bacteroidales bacterium]
MAVNSLIIDTNAYAAYKKGNSEATQIITEVDTIILTPIIIGELLSGFKIGKKENQNREEFYQFLRLSKVNILYIDSSTSDEYSKIVMELREKGKPIPTNDIWIAASAKQYKLSIFSYDQHFDFLDNISLIRALKDLA